MIALPQRKDLQNGSSQENKLIEVKNCFVTIKDSCGVNIVKENVQVHLDTLNLISQGKHKLQN